MNEQTTYDTAVAFADVAGSSRLYKEQGNNEAIRRIGALMNRLAQTVQQYRGSVVKTIGDEIMCHFRDAGKACDAMIAFQCIGEQQDLPLRIGLAWGNVIEQDNDLFGQAVNDAAAVARIARARQIIATNTFRSNVPTECLRRLSVFDHIRLKGHAEISTIYRIEWETASNASTTARHTVILGALAPTQQQITLGFCKESGAYDTLMLTARDVPLHIGRDAMLCQLHSGSTHASRDHCHIDYAHGKFVLVDHSTNGTYVRMGGGQQVYLRRQETPLIGNGEIGLGEQVKDGNRFVIRFNS